MDAAMIEAGLIDQINAIDTSFELREWKQNARGGEHVKHLDAAAKERLQRAYVTRLADLMTIELAGTP